MYFLKKVDIRVLDFLKSNFKAPKKIYLDGTLLFHFNQSLGELSLSMLQLRKSVEVLTLYGFLIHNDDEDYFKIDEFQISSTMKNPSLPVF